MSQHSIADRDKCVRKPYKRLTMEKFVASPLLISVSIIRGLFFMILLVHFMSLPRRVFILLRTRTNQNNRLLFTVLWLVCRWMKTCNSFSWCFKRWNNQKSRFIVAFGLPISALVNFYKLYIYTCKYFVQCYMSVLKDLIWDYLGTVKILTYSRQWAICELATDKGFANKVVGRPRVGL